jgi:hypothetical protein
MYDNIRMKLFHFSAKKLVATFFLALALLSVTSLIPLKGSYLLNAAEEHDATHRDVRGIPFVFLKRSYEDGECEVANSNSITCLTPDVDMGHTTRYGYLVADFIFWIILSGVLVEISTRYLKIHNIRK